MVQEINYKKVFLYIVVGIVIISIVLDACNRWLSIEHTLSEESNFSMFFKASLFVVSFFISVYYYRWFLYLSLLFVSVSLLGAFSLVDNIDVNWLLKIKYMVKYLYPPSVFLSLSYFARRFNDVNVPFFIILKYLYVSQALITIVGALFGISFFNSYHSRFGFSPLIASINESSLYYVIGISLLYFDFTNKITANSINRILSLIVVVTGGLLLGTKSVYLYLMFLILYHILSNKRKRWIASVLLIGVFLFIIAFIVPFFIKIHQDFGFLNSISSMRYELFMNKVIPLIVNNWEWYNFLIGGNNSWQHFVEMDLIDLFTFSGLVGLSIILFIWFKSAFKFNNRLGWFFAISVMILANMSGHFLWSGVNAVYLAMFAIIMQDNSISKYNN